MKFFCQKWSESIFFWNYYSSIQYREGMYINSGFFEPLIQTMVFIARNDRIELKNNKTKKKI